MSQSRASLVLALITCVAAPHSARGDNDGQLASRSAHDLYDYLLAGLEHERQKLQTAKFRIEGTMLQSLAGSATVEGPVQFDGAVDYRERKIRFDRTEPTTIRTVTILASPTRLDDPAAVPGAHGAGEVESLLSAPELRAQTRKYIRVPGRSMFWSHSMNGGVIDSTRQPGISIEAEDSKRHELPFDVRAVGLMIWADLGRYSLPEMVDAYRRKRNDLMDVVEESESPGTYRCSLRFNFTVKGQSKPPWWGAHTLWIDSKRGFSPIRLHIAPPPPANPPRAEPRAEDRSEAHWIERSGVWIPEKWVLTYGDGENRFKYDLSFTWESINEPLPDRLFSYEDFGAPKGTPVFDQRAGRQMLVEELGGDTSPASLSAKARPGLLRLFLGIAAVLFAALLILWLRRRNARPAAS